MTWVVDASVVVKWFVREDGHEAALGLLDDPQALAAPDVLVPAVGAVAWRETRAGNITRTQANLLTAAIPAYVANLVPAAGLIERAMELAFDMDQPVPDCLYLTCAEQMDGVLVTANDRLIKAVRGTDLESITCHLHAWKAISGA